MYSNDSFDKAFAHLTGHPPFPWQRALFERFLSEPPENIPESCNVPTGLGKTNVVAIWLLALARNPENMPRRLVYVVNRRTVVDQTTNEVEKLRKNLANLSPPMWFSELAISTLRGQFADNREWSTDPARPAVICGTVDMIGSRLLFSGYGVGWKARPLHAGFLGQDTLLVHDEAHLEPAFQEMLNAIRSEQENEQQRCQSANLKPLHVMEMTATGRRSGSTITLTEEDRKNDAVRQRIHAAKELHLEPLRDPKKLADQIVERALQFKDSGLAVLVFVRTVEDVLKVCEALKKGKLPVENLTGTLRGKERDDLVKKPVFQRFLPEPPDGIINGTVYLVCTSAGEVGVNISADHLVCDLSTFECMAQRFGRVNRFGRRTDAAIHVVHTTDHKDPDYGQRLERTFELLGKLNGDASPNALGELPEAERIAAFAPTPAILPTSDILFDAWALTSIRGKLPGRPPVQPYLHGLPTDWQPPETQVAWRKEVGEITGELFAKITPEMLLDEFPLLPHELLREPGYRAFRHLETMAKRLKDHEVPVWLRDDNGTVTVLTLAELADKDNKDRINGMTVILPPSAGGLQEGMFDGSAAAPADGSLDVADEWFLQRDPQQKVRQRKRVWNDETDSETNVMHEVMTVRFPAGDEDEEKVWRWYRIANEGDPATKRAVEWSVHVGDVEREAAKIVDALPLPEALKRAVKLAAKYHDHGKRRALFQLSLGNANPNVLLAKSGSGSGGRFGEPYRHEFGSLIDIRKELDALQLGEHEDLVLHLIATHHGRARPHFPAEEAFDPDHSHVEAEKIAADVPRRFARLQRKYGRWGLAYLESLLRAGDWAASGHPSAFWNEEPK
jgi:CRISPR-associated endonuclease/helicase Cas3